MSQLTPSFSFTNMEQGNIPCTELAISAIYSSQEELFLFVVDYNSPSEFEALVRTGNPHRHITAESWIVCLEIFPLHHFGNSTAVTS